MQTRYLFIPKSKVIGIQWMINNSINIFIRSIHGGLENTIFMHGNCSEIRIENVLQRFCVLIQSCRFEFYLPLTFGYHHGSRQQCSKKRIESGHGNFSYYLVFNMLFWSKNSIFSKLHYIIYLSMWCSMLLGRRWCWHYF